ncbi:MAG: hypothetical protein JXX28_18220 [Deltaproteobacteria bacterium]|nr:hypothetical protein [Deltaproteobacteria bacterium]
MPEAAHQEVPGAPVVMEQGNDLAEVPLLFVLALGLPVFAVFAYLILTLSVNRSKRLAAQSWEE